MSTLKYILLSPIMLLVTACQSSSNSSPAPKPGITITSMNWSAESTPADYWSAASTTKPGLVYNFTIHFEGNAALGDIKYARVYLPNDKTHYWTFNLSEQFDATNKTIGGTTHFWHSLDTNELPIGTLTAEVCLNSDTKTTYDFVMGIPGSQSPGAYQYVYSPEDEVVPLYPSMSQAALARPTITQFSNTGAQISVQFTVNGANVNNGRVWLYDTSGTYIGKSPAFRDAASGVSSSLLQDAAFHHNPGESNALTLGMNDITDATGAVITPAQFASISHCRAYVIDGQQFTTLSPPSYGRYDYRAISTQY